MLTQAGSEQEFIRRLADEFRGEGYQRLDPRHLRDELPSGYVPDLLMQRGDEMLVVEIKSPEEHRSLEQVRTLKQTVERNPNWRFRLYVIPQFQENNNLKDNLEDMKKFVSEAKRLNRNRKFEAASVLLWMAIEIALRTILTQRQSRPNLGVSGLSMAKSLSSLGELDEDELQLLEHAWRTRNLGVHGFRLAPRDPLKPELTALAMRLAERAEVEAQ